MKYLEQLSIEERDRFLKLSCENDEFRIKIQRFDKDISELREKLKDHEKTKSQYEELKVYAAKSKKKCKEWKSKYYLAE